VSWDTIHGETAEGQSTGMDQTPHPAPALPEALFRQTADEICATISRVEWPAPRARQRLPPKVQAKVQAIKHRRLAMDTCIARREAMALLQQVPESLQTAEERDDALERLAEDARPKVRAILLSVVRFSRANAKLSSARLSKPALARYAEEFKRREALLAEATRTASSVAASSP
jgi:hypothetical protein